MAERKWTPSQNDAIIADSGTVLVSAAAGSGKTSVLTERIVRKLTDPEKAVSPDSLLVVTFTNAAAQEMRGRIYSGITAKIAENSQKKSDYIFLLSRLSEMQVCTMDSFCMNLVKENCHILGIEPDFRMLEQGESAGLKKQIVSAVLERRFSEKAETFLPLAQMFDSGKNDMKLMETVIRLSDFSMSEAQPEIWLEGLADAFSVNSACESVWGKYIVREVISDFMYCIGLSDAALKLLETDEELEAKYKELFEAENNILKNALTAFSEACWNEKNEIVMECFADIKSNRLPTAPKGYTNNPVKLSVQAKRDEIKSVLADITEYMYITEEENAEDLPVLYAVARELTETVIEYNEKLLELKKEKSAYDFSDISHFALSLLTDPESPDGKTPLARELTQKFSEILIDEYQDTNRAQDELFYSVSKQGKNMFLVGDVKQSIYRFRLASPEIFIEKCNVFPYYDGKEEKSKIILGHNFRSRKGILDCVNFVFSNIMSPECGEINYNKDEWLNFPESSESQSSVDVRVSFLETDENKAADTEGRYIASLIRSCLDSGECVGEGDKKRKAKPSDFCILLRSPSSSAVKYVNALKNAGLPVSSDVNSSFFETAEIKTVMSYLRVIDNPGRDTDLLAVLMSPVFGFTPDDVSRLRIKYGKRISLYYSLLEGAKMGDSGCKRVLERIEHYKKLSACAGADAVIREIYSDTAYSLIAGAMPDGDIRKKNLRKLLDKAEKSSEHYSSLCDFVRYMDILRENSSEMSDSGSSGGVRIMSMHRSKGLEFPFVFIAGTSKPFNKQDIRSNLIIDHTAGLGMKRKEPENIKNYDTLSSIALRKMNTKNLLSEELRIYYVALTRAKQRLYIPVALKNMEKILKEYENLLAGTKSISPYLISHLNDASKWFISAFVRHPDYSDLRGNERIFDETAGNIHFEFIDSVSEEITEDESTALSVPDEEITEAIRKRASFSYKWAPVACAGAKHTASSLKDEHFDVAGFGRSVPAFMYAQNLTPTDVGTLTHRFLQYCNFEVCKHSPEKERARLIAEGRFTEKQAGGVDMDAIKVFVNSDIMKRAEKSPLVYREKQFTMAKSIRDIDPSVPEEFKDEKTVVIGKIDLVFLEDGAAVIVDYKTDNINDINILKERYYPQMRLYAEALKKSLELDVRECILYSLKLKDSISLLL